MELDGHSSPDHRRVGEAISRMFRITARAKIGMATRDPDLRDFATMVLLGRLVEGGAMRAGALAGCLHMDASQVSRTTAAAVREGLVERRVDPADSRATLLAATEAGRARHRRFAQARARHLDAAVADWDAAHIRRFAADLERFVTAFEQLTLRATDERPESAVTREPQTATTARENA